ncbi:hypothetical protein AB9B98_12410, partial [Escherichia coli]
PWNNSLLIIGGETAGGKAVTDSVLISVKDNKVTVQINTRQLGPNCPYHK